MQKNEIINLLAEGTGLSKVETAAVIDGLIATMRYELKNEGHIELRGLGNFKVTERKARRVRNPNTKKMMDVPAKNTVTFRPSGTLKIYLNETDENDNLKPKTEDA
ncbi:HU family DNA-binding protein [bacterium]|nr:HU family DNA-binding protein [bacterium]